MPYALVAAFPRPPPDHAGGCEVLPVSEGEAEQQLHMALDAAMSAPVRSLQVRGKSLGPPPPKPPLYIRKAKSTGWTTTHIKQEFPRHTATYLALTP